jgi:hypothetical protein
VRLKSAVQLLSIGNHVDVLGLSKEHPQLGFDHFDEGTSGS